MPVPLADKPACTPFELSGPDGVLLRGDRFPGRDRQLLFMTGFLSKRWGKKSEALARWCAERHWGFCCFDYRGSGSSEGEFSDYTLKNWMEDARVVVEMLKKGPPISIVGNSLGGWIAWLVAQDYREVRDLLLIAPAFNMMGARAKHISPERREAWKRSGWMPYDDDEAHRNFPLSWKWVEESETLWQQRHSQLRRIPTAILHGLQDTVISPAVSWNFTQKILAQDPEYPLELIYKTGDHRLSSPEVLETFRKLVVL